MHHIMSSIIALLQGLLPDSPFQYQLLGLNLLCLLSQVLNKVSVRYIHPSILLSQNRVAEFHTELERLPAKEVQNNVYIKHPVSLEQYIMEGSYNKVLSLTCLAFHIRLCERRKLSSHLI